MTIRKKLTLWYAGLLALCIIIFSMIVFMIMRVAMFNSVDEMLSRTASDVIGNIRVIPALEGSQIHNRVSFRSARSDDIFHVPGLAIQVWQTFDGVSNIDPVLVKASTDSMPLDESSLTVESERFSNVVINEIHGRVTTRPFSSGGRQIGVVQVASSIQAIHQMSYSMLIIMIIACAVTVMVAVAVGMWLSRRTLRPIDDITNAASKIAQATDLSTRLTWHGPMDELGRLTSVFNQMMARLEDLFSVQQRFVADASHELRTPLTSIQGNVETIVRYGMDPDALEAIVADSQRMSRLVSDLLMLARADYGELKIDLYPLEIDRVLLQVYEQSHLLAAERRLKIRLGRLESARIQGNADRMTQLILNLLSNAIKFTPDGGAITLSAYSDGDEGVIVVQDSGIGIRKADQSRIFDRFFQADYARAHRSDSDGAGLGLSIAKWIVESHQGTIKVESEFGKGSTFIVRLPLLKEQSHHHKPEHHAPSRSRFERLRSERHIIEN